MPKLIIRKKYAKICNFGSKLSPPICNLWEEKFTKNFIFANIAILYSNLEPCEKQNNFWWIRLGEGVLGRSSKNPHGFIRGWPKTMCVHKGEGGSKIQSTWFMDATLHDVSIFP